VTNYCSLNKSTVKNSYPLPWIADLLDNLQGDYSFTKMDLKVGYHQVYINLVSHLGKCVVIYLDDTSVFSTSWTKSLQCNHNILELLWEHTFEVKKSYFG
jgi:hypothetical protein